MKYQIIFLPFWVINCSVIPQNDTEIFIKYGHSDVERIIDREKIVEQKIDDQKIDEKKIDKEKIPENVQDDIVFIPNDKPIVRNEDTFSRNVDEAVNSRGIGDLMHDSHFTATEKPNKDVLFITGKNNENIEHQETKKQTRKAQQTQNKTAPKRNKHIDCVNLDCVNNVSSVCGGRKENNKWKYRLFMNDCYFRKVNCAFQYANNRYEKVSSDNCKNVGGHYSIKQYSFKPPPPPPPPVIKQKTLQINESRRNFPSRRSLSMGIDGVSCDHSCPISCTEDHNPECAVSSVGQRKVFLNHCKLDQNSCSYNIVWYRRPLSECVGGRRADMDQNRGFVSWMQRVGIIDKNGRMVLS